MLIDTHAHVTGPAELYTYFRQLTRGSGGAARSTRDGTRRCELHAANEKPGWNWIW